MNLTQPHPSHDDAFERFATAKAPWLLDDPETDADRLQRTVAREAFWAGRESAPSPARTAAAQDNQAFRALFSLPPIQASTSTALTVPETPAPKTVTGDRELDAVLWLRDCINTGHDALIDQALEAFKRIKTPPKELEDRYCAYLRAASGGNPFAPLFGGFGFADLEALAKTSRKKLARRQEAMARFGSTEALFKRTPAEEACKLALLDREIEDARKAGVRFVRDAVFREAAEKRLAVLEDLRPKVQALRELPESAGSLKQGGLQTPACWCESCDAAANSGLLSRMSLCPQCGNKRCPRATHHNNACTGSNEPCQPGSSWEHCRPAEKLQVEQEHAGGAGA